MAEIGNHARDYVAYQLHSRNDLAKRLPCRYTELFERPGGWDYGRPDVGVSEAGGPKPAVTTSPPTVSH